MLSLLPTFFRSFVASNADGAKRDLAVMSPIYRLPPELLGQIFLECAPPADLERSNILLSPFVLAQVCRQWRAIAHAMPMLWSTFDFMQCGWGWSTEDESLAEIRFQRLLDLSGQLPLSFRFSAYLIGLVEHNASDHPILSKLFHLSDRWRNVWLCLPYRAYSEEKFKYALSLPVLESLILENPHIAIGGLLPEGTRPPETFNLSSRLTRLSLQKYLLPTRAFAFSWSQIRQLHLKENLIDGNDYVTILKAATHLESFSAENNHFAQPLSTSIVSASINSLTIATTTSSSGVEPFLAPLVLPNLTHLNLRLWKPSQRDINAAVDFLERSGSSVTHFTCRSLDDGQLVRLLEKLPQLVHVGLCGSLIRPSFVGRLKNRPKTRVQAAQLDPVLADEAASSWLPLSPSSSSSSPPPPAPSPPPCLLPNLESLLLSDNSLTPDLAGLTDAISSRLPISREYAGERAGAVSPVATLKRVKVLLRKEVELTAVNQFSTLSESEWGKRVVVASSDRDVMCADGL
ncbi:hypothetical protein APHAL10511_007760 [Amanita phalloides]|nr:hypothetical protein APHAL10511_007760 [Amanita phalloides]